jgi:hypothetical protein
MENISTFASMATISTTTLHLQNQNIFNHTNPMKKTTPHKNRATKFQVLK